MNPDEIDVAKVPDLPPRSRDEEDVYAFLHEEAMQRAGENLSIVERSRRTV